MSDETTASDLLAQWRTTMPPDTEAESPQARRLAQALIARARAQHQTAAGEQRLRRAEANDAMAWLLLADYLPGLLSWTDDAGYVGDEADVEGACLWLAAWFGNHWARLVLVLRLITVHADPTLIENHLLMTPLAGVLPTDLLAGLGALRLIEGYDGVRRGSQAQQSRARVDAEQASDTDTDMSVPGESMRVLATEPVPATSRDERALIDRYAMLAKPVRLVPAEDIEDVADFLWAEFPWFKDIVEAIRMELVLARRMGQRHVRLPPLLIHGAPGIGKTRFVEQLAEFLQVPLGRIVAAGSSDNRMLAGTARGWSTTQPCLPLIVMRQREVANPLILVDELDKASASDRNGRLADTLAAMLDPDTARTWPDECLLANADLSQVSWVLVCTDLHRVPPMLRARCRILRAGRPSPEHFDVILRAALDDIANQYGAGSAALPELDPAVIRAMRAGFQSGRLQLRQLVTLARQSLALTAVAEHEAGC